MGVHRGEYHRSDQIGEKTGVFTDHDPPQVSLYNAPCEEFLDSRRKNIKNLRHAKPSEIHKGMSCPQRIRIHHPHPDFYQTQ